MSAEDYDAWAETVYLLRSPANATRLMSAVERDKARLIFGADDAWSPLTAATGNDATGSDLDSAC